MVDLNEIRDEVCSSILEADPSLKRTDMEFLNQTVLLCSLKCGADEDLIARILGYEPEFVKQIGARLRASKIWQGDGLSKAHVDGWAHEEKGGVAFLCDAMVAAGAMYVASVEDGEPQYSMTESGRAEVEKKFGAP